MNYIINLFGTGIRYWHCEVDQDMFDEMNRIRIKNQVEWEIVLFNLEFLNYYQLYRLQPLSFLHIAVESHYYHLRQILQFFLI